ncbi:MAG: hypothetical protein WAM82_29445 [Thermoanaerobaculia bacterium]
MASRGGLSIRAVKRRLRALRQAVDRLDQELTDLARDMPSPSAEDFAALLSREAPLTLEAALLGWADHGHFHLAEASGALSLALATKPGSLGTWIRPDLRQALANVFASRAPQTSSRSPGRATRA